MMRNFFRALEYSHVQYMLISGQATVLYGAATFSEDIDLWVCPEEENWCRFVSVLQEVGAKTYKAAPPLSLCSVKKGHGFHFEIPETDKEDLWFLDVMGVVPRVEIKKTRRLQDYPIISNLVKGEFDRLCSAGEISNEDWVWMLTNSFDAEDIAGFLDKYDKAKDTARKLSRPCLPYCIDALHDDEALFNAAKEISLEIENLLQQDWELLPVGGIPVWGSE